MNISQLKMANNESKLAWFNAVVTAGYNMANARCYNEKLPLLTIGKFKRLTNK